jgi:hypothetical protein
MNLKSRIWINPEYSSWRQIRIHSSIHIGVTDYVFLETIHKFNGLFGSIGDQIIEEFIDLNKDKVKPEERLI